VARDPVYYRTKATYVLWMLRDLAGSEALGRALRGYQPGSDTAGNGFEQVLERASGKDLKWFFEDWVYHDRGLPDLSIAGVYPNKASVPGSYIVAVDVSNSGTAEAQVPVSVSSGTTTVTEMLRIPAKSKVSHRFVLQGKPAEVAVNDGTVPEVEASVHRQTLSMPAAPE
jgi:aminopeptidase N